MRKAFLIIILCMMTSVGQMRDAEPKIDTVTTNLLTVNCDRVETNTIALNTNEGLIIFDTQSSPDLAAVVRESITEYFANNIKYVINTHHHYDHVQGNQIFEDAPIIAHKNCPPAMHSAAVNSALMENHDINVETGDTNTIPPPPPPMTMNYNTPGFTLTTPDITFERELIINSGDHTLHLFYYGPAHTDNDILIVIPQEKALITGDLFFKNWLPHFGNYETPDVGAWHDLISRIFSEYPDIQYVLPGHGGFMTIDEFKVRFNYLIDLHNAVGDLLKAGKPDQAIIQELTLEKFAPGLIELNMPSSRGGTLHEGNISKSISIHKKTDLHSNN